MEFGPPTRLTLLQRLVSDDRESAWHEFVELYEPVIYRLACRKGLQAADADEVTQNVLLAVSRAIDRFDLDQSKGSFRGWLLKICRNMTINQLAKRNRQPMTGAAMEEVFDVSANATETQWFDLERRRRLFERAAELVERAVSPTAWICFWSCSVLGKSGDAVAQELGIQVGTVYVNKSRVLAQIRKVVQRFELEESQG